MELNVASKERIFVRTTLVARPALVAARRWHIILFAAFEMVAYGTYWIQVHPYIPMLGRGNLRVSR